MFTFIYCYKKKKIQIFWKKKYNNDDEITEGFQIQFELVNFEFVGANEQEVTFNKPFFRKKKYF